MILLLKNENNPLFYSLTHFFAVPLYPIYINKYAGY